MEVDSGPEAVAVPVAAPAGFDFSVNVQGTCVMGSATPADPKSWRAWNGHGFNLRVIDPYREGVDEPDSYWCETVSMGEIGALAYDLSYNTFLDMFVAVSTAGPGFPAPGIYFSVS